MAKFNVQAALQAGHDPERIKRYLMKRPDLEIDLPKEQPKEKKGRGLLDLLSVGTSIGGGVLGSAVAPGVGTVAGSALGGGLGELLEQMISGEKTDLGGAGKEALWGGAGAGVGLGIGKLLGGVGRAGGSVGKEGTRAFLAKNLPKTTSIDKIDELAGVAKSSGVLGSNVAKARKFSQLAKGLGAERTSLIEGIKEGIPRKNVLKMLEKNARGYIDVGEEKNVLQLLERLPKGKTVTHSDVLKFKEGLNKVATIVNKGGQGSAKSRAASALQQSVDEMLGGIEKVGTKYSSLTKQIGQNLPIKQAYTNAAAAGKSVPLPFVGRVGLGPLTRPVEALQSYGGELTSRVGSSPITSQSLGQAGARMYRPSGGDVSTENTGAMDFGSVAETPEPSKGNKVSELLQQVALMDMMKGGKNVTKLLALSKAMNGGIDANTQKKVNQLTQAKTIIEEFGNRALALNPSESAPLARLKGAGVAVGTPFGLNSPEERAFNSNRNAIRVLLARSLGEVGNLSETEQRAALDMIPDIGDSREEVQLKVSGLISLINTLQGQLAPQENGGNDIMSLLGGFE